MNLDVVEGWGIVGGGGVGEDTVRKIKLIVGPLDQAHSARRSMQGDVSQHSLFVECGAPQVGSQRTWEV